ncbi:hypothetical protein LTR53_014417 [Teratosphaeriaceae sp. CCFEE 6253]|nr:hypothetical protein LTR53_014417 [Teratosphaeriaceae sp. CCFEE 6253]
MRASIVSAFLAGLLAPTSTPAQDANGVAAGPSSASLALTEATSASLALVETTSIACPSATQVITATATAWVTETAAYNGSGQVTVTETDAETTTVTITTDLGSTVTLFTTLTDVSHATLSTYTSAKPTIPAQQRAVRQAVAPGCPAFTLSTRTQTRSSTTTLYPRLAPTTTLRLRVGITYTETITRAAPTVYIALTTSATSTTTLAYAAPTFTRVFGPKAGCVDRSAATAFSLDPVITDTANATTECQGLCAQDGLCGHVYVQRMLEEYGTAAPYWACYFNLRAVVVERDLLCGEQEGTWGVAVGYDAMGRGS